MCISTQRESHQLQPRNGATGDGVIYADIEIQPPASAANGKQGPDDVTTPTPINANDGVIYSELQNVHNAEPSNEPYANVNEFE